MQGPQGMGMLLMSRRESHLKLEGRARVQGCLWLEASESQGSRRWRGHPQREGEDKRERKEEPIEYVCPLGNISLLQLIAAGIFCCKYWVTSLWAVSRALPGNRVCLFFLMMSYISPTFHFLQLLQSCSGLCIRAFCHLRRQAKLCRTAMPLRVGLNSQTHTDAKYSNGPEWNYKEHSLAFPQTLPDSL